MENIISSKVDNSERQPLLSDRNMSMRLADSTAYLNQDKNAGCWNRKTGLEQKLVLFSGFLAVVCVSLIIAVAVIATKESDTVDPANTSTRKPSTVTPTPKPKPEPPKVCQTAECRNAGVYYSSTMNLRADPCNNFYDFVCGNWTRDTIIPDDKGRWGVFDDLRDQLASVSMDQLQKEVTDPSKYSAVNNARLLYQTCLETEETTEADAKENLKTIVETVSGGSDIESANWLKMIPKVLNNYGLSYIISLGVGADINNTENNIIYLDQPGFGLGRDILLNQTTDKNMQMIEAYKNYTLNIYFDLAKLSSSVVEEEDQAIWAENYVAFETEMVKLTRSPAERRDASSWYFPMTIENLKTKVPNIDWLDLITESLQGSGVPVDVQTTVIVKEETYFLNVVKLIDSNTTYKSMARDYILVRTLMSRGPFIYPEFRNAQFEFQKVVNGIEKQSNITQRCFDLANDFFGHAVGLLYIEAVNFNEEAKSDMLKMSDNLARSFEQLVEKNQWMDEETKVQAKNKLAAMTEFIGYPDWIKDSEELNKFYQMDALTPKKFFENFQKTMITSVRKSLQEISKINNRTHDWVSQASIVNAFYSPSANSITFPAGILQNPFYVQNRTKAMNYGSIGYVIGHEITHGFDDQGRQYAGDGTFSNWWSAKTLAEFNIRKQCFIDQYSAITDDQAETKLNGAQTIGENIADNGGIREAYNAYMLSGPEKETIPGLEAYDDKQLFFIAAGSVWCTKFRKEELIQQILNGVHSPGKYRATVPLSNTEDFAKAFNCKVGAAMNTPVEEKCIIW